jgi:ESS family glutamate:Na+ symporter
VFQLGAMPVLILTGGVLIFWIAFGLINFTLKPKHLVE